MLYRFMRAAQPLRWSPLVVDLHRSILCVAAVPQL